MTYVACLINAARRLGWDSHDYYDGVWLSHPSGRNINVQTANLDPAETGHEAQYVLEATIIRMAGGPFPPVINFWKAHP
jgi:hypothetical protein